MNRRPVPAVRAARLVSAAVVLGLLVSGIAGGLLRAGAPMLPFAGPVALPGAAAMHGLVMVCGVMGTVIGLERAVALGGGWPLLAPLASAACGWAALTGAFGWAGPLALLTAGLFAAANVAVIRRQDAPHTRLLLLGALAWLAGNAWLVAGGALDAALPWWFAFLALTIAAERLEMTRLLKRRAAAGALLLGVLGLMLAGAAATPLWPGPGALVFGAGLVGVALWLLRFDIAWRTVRSQGLTRYMAVCLLLGHGWLAVAGLAWMGWAAGLPWRDVALHAFGLGFVFSMVMGHAPVILPAVAGLKLRFSVAFFVPLALLQASMLARAAWPGALPWASWANALALAVFAATVAASAWAWRHGQAARVTQRSGHGLGHS